MASSTPAARTIIEIEPPVAGSELGAVAKDWTTGSGSVVAAAGVATGGTAAESGVGGAGGGGGVVGGT
jgi:Zn-dependent alcohol dehydrogenase